VQELQIAFISPGTYPPDFGGAQLRLHRTFLRLRRYHMLRVKVLALAGESTVAGWSEVDGIPVRRLPANPGVLSSFCSAGAHLVGERRSGTDVVYTVSTSRLVYWSGIWARAIRRPLVVEFANNNIEETPQRRLMAQLLARSAALAIAISRPVADQFRGLGVPDERIWVRPNPVDTTRFHLPSAERRAAARQRFGVGDDTILHVLVGVLSERKNHIVGIGAIEQLPDPHRLIIAGPVFPKERDYAAQLARRVRSSPAGRRLSLIAEFVSDIEELMSRLLMDALERGGPRQRDAGGALLWRTLHHQQSPRPRRTHQRSTEWLQSGTRGRGLVGDRPVHHRPVSRHRGPPHPKPNFLVSGRRSH
jgi:glycosyltransferase involved in cell wall biosynthesis